MKTAQKQHRFQLVLAALLTAFIIVMSFTPLGFIPLPFVKMTIVHIPVILGSVMLGPVYGSWLGFVFGASSFLVNTFTPAVTSFTFSPLIPIPGADSGSAMALIVCFVPRILVGVLPYFVYIAINKLLFIRKDGHPLSLTVAGVIGSITNTVGVMGLIWLLFRDAYAAAKGIEPELVLGVISSVVGFNGVIEAIAAGLLVAIIGAVMCKAMNRVR